MSNFKDYFDDYGIFMILLPFLIISMKFIKNTFGKIILFFGFLIFGTIVSYYLKDKKVRKNIVEQKVSKKHFYFINFFYIIFIIMIIILWILSNKNYSNKFYYYLLMPCIIFMTLFFGYFFYLTYINYNILSTDYKNKTIKTYEDKRLKYQYLFIFGFTFLICILGLTIMFLAGY